jgi:hypothetical protein
MTSCESPHLFSLTQIGGTFEAYYIIIFSAAIMASYIVLSISSLISAGISPIGGIGGISGFNLEHCMSYGQSPYGLHGIDPSGIMFIISFMSFSFMPPVAPP